ncbi:MAG TPA: type II toxin-antitoxin system death-on-curing family toxin [Deferrisomatales bacterium]|nr:type II toxin-antitoxin system death-on-curing family toxin [Deferrisomatales bacterium]
MGNPVDRQLGPATARRGTRSDAFLCMQKNVLISIIYEFTPPPFRALGRSRPARAAAPKRARVIHSPFSETHVSPLRFPPVTPLHRRGPAGPAGARPGGRAQPATVHPASPPKGAADSSFRRLPPAPPRSSLAGACQVRGEPVWILPATILAVRDAQMAEHGGAAGLRDPRLLDSALAHPRNLFAYGTPSLFEPAAAYGARLIQNHPFTDGNKRTGYVATRLFLVLNGMDLTAAPKDRVLTFMRLAAGTLQEAGLADWFAANGVPRP